MKSSQTSRLASAIAALALLATSAASRAATGDGRDSSVSDFSTWLSSFVHDYSVYGFVALGVGVLLMLGIASLPVPAPVTKEAELMESSDEQESLSA